MSPDTQTAPPAAASDKAAVRALVDQMNDAWGRGDADDFAACFTEDAHYTVFDGTRLQGRTAIAESHRPLFERFMKGSRLVGDPPSIRVLAPNVALVLTKGAILMRGQKTPSRGRFSVQTLVAVKQDGTWRFAAFQNTRYRPFTESFLGKVLMRLAPRGPWSALSPDTTAPSGSQAAPRER